MMPGGVSPYAWWRITRHDAWWRITHHDAWWHITRHDAWKKHVQAMLTVDGQTSHILI